LLLVAAAALTRQYWKDSQMEFWLSSVLIIAAGIPHGALDHFAARHNRKKFDLTVYVFLYIVCAALYLTLWWFAPGIAFLIFLLITAWHFGETDFSCFTDNQGAGLYSFVYGTSITMWLLMQDKPLLFRWTALITGDNQNALSIVSWLAVVPVYTVVSGARPDAVYGGRKQAGTPSGQNSISPVRPVPEPNLAADGFHPVFSQVGTV
jgi:Brp/Blh family beta-carotene 15,15'-monooxygenase